MRSEHILTKVLAKSKGMKKSGNFEWDAIERAHEASCKLLVTISSGERCQLTGKTVANRLSGGMVSIECPQAGFQMILIPLVNVKTEFELLKADSIVYFR